MTNDALNRIYADGCIEPVNAVREFFLAGNEEAERAYYEHNRKFYAQVKRRGLD